MLFKHAPLFGNFRVRHFGKGEVVFAHIGHTEVINFCHRETFSRAYGRTKSAKAALAHVDVKLCCVYPLRCAIGSLANFLNCANWLNIYAINRADFSTLVTNNTVVDLIVESVAAVVGHRLHLVRILDGGNASAVSEIIRRLDRDYRLRRSGAVKVPDGYAQTAN
jgi:hypothetical protein